MRSAPISGCRRISACSSARQWRRLAQDRFRHGELAEIVQQRRTLDHRDLIVAKAQRTGHADRERGDAVGVGVGIRVAQRQHRQRRVERLVVVDAQDRKRVRQPAAPCLHFPLESLAPSS